MEAGQFCVLRPLAVRYQLRHPPAKTVRDSRILGNGGGTTEIMTELVAKLPTA